MGSDTLEEACSMNVSRKASETEKNSFLKSNSKFADGLKDLRNLGKQLYSAADRFESSYDKNDNHKKFVLETSKDYVAKALVSTVDHLGSVADKLTKLLEDNSKEFSATSIRFCCVQQRIAACQEFVVAGGMSQQSFAVEAKRHHMQYVNPVTAPVYQIMCCKQNKVNKDMTRLISEFLGVRVIDFLKQSSSSSADNSCSDASLAPRMKQDRTLFRRESPMLASSEPCPNRQVFSFTVSAPNKEAGRRSNIRLSEPGRRSVSPFRFPLRRSESGENSSISPSPADVNKQRRPSVPQRSLSATRRHETTKSERDMESYTKRSMQLFKAMLSVNNRSTKDMITSTKNPEKGNCRRP